MNAKDSLEALLDAYFDDRLDPESQARLDAELRASDEACARFWERAALEQSLESWGRGRRGELTALAELDAPRSRRVHWLAASGWAAAAALLAAWIIQSRPPAESPAAAAAGREPPEAGLAAAGTPAGVAPEATGYPVAYLSRLVGARTSERHLTGQSIGAGEEVSLEEGLMEVVLYSGARVTLEGPARFVPRSDLEIAVLEGSAQADVPDSAVGFRMVLPDGVVTDFGTSFDVMVGPDGGSRVQVLDGEIEVSGRGGEGRRRLTAGQAGTLAGSGQLELVEFAPMAVGESLDDLAEKQARARMERWRSYNRRLNADKSLIVHFSLMPDEWGSELILNHARSAASPRSGTIISADWSEGRWSGKPALSFRRPSDRVRVEIPGEFPQATFASWVRVDGLPREYNGLFFSEYGIDGEVHWQFSSDGRYFFGVRPEGSPPVAPFHRAFSQPVISPWVFGSWRMLATTYDAGSREVVHYVDAIEVSRTVLDDSVPLRFGRATLGNFFDPQAERRSKDPSLSSEWSFRNWTGAIDEFILFSRVLSAEEIAELHEAGRVD